MKFNPQPKPTKNKYKAVKQTYNGYSYDSKLESEYAVYLDWLVKIKEVKKWERQVKISLDVNGVHIANYFVDFEVWFTDGRNEYHEVKSNGTKTDLWRMKWNLSKALNPNKNFIVIMKVPKIF